jgi:hypothetical protein
MSFNSSFRRLIGREVKYVVEWKQKFRIKSIPSMAFTYLHRQLSQCNTRGEMWLNKNRSSMVNLFSLMIKSIPSMAFTYLHRQLSQCNARGEMWLNRNISSMVNLFSLMAFTYLHRQLSQCNTRGEMWLNENRNPMVKSIPSMVFTYLHRQLSQCNTRGEMWLNGNESLIMNGSHAMQKMKYVVEWKHYLEREKYCFMISTDKNKTRVIVL